MKLYDLLFSLLNTDGKNNAFLNNTSTFYFVCSTCTPITKINFAIQFKIPSSRSPDIKPSMVIHTYNPSTQEAQAKRSHVESYPWLQREFKDSLSYKAGP